MLNLKCIITGALETNSYIIYGSEKALIVDSGDTGEKIVQFIEEKNLVPEMIINTHGHYDHISGNKSLKKRFKCPIGIHKIDAEYLYKPRLNLSKYTVGDMKSPRADREFEDGDIIHLEGEKIEIIHLPGHTKGGIGLYFYPHLVSGDTLFRENMGRTDLPRGNQRELMDSIRSRIYVLPDEVKVYPGHGESTTVGYEKMCNPFVSGTVI